MNYLKQIWPEIKWAAILLIAFLLAPNVLLWIDPSTAQMDLGVMQVLLYAAQKIIISSLLVWALLKMGFPTLWRYITRENDAGETEFRADWSTTLPEFRLLITMGTIVAILAFVAITLATS